MSYPNGFFVYPDPLTGPNIISGASFLYFQKPLLLTLPPMVITKEPYELLRLIKERCPPWADDFDILFSSWRMQQDSSQNVLKLLEPLKGRCFKTIWSVYNCDTDALNMSELLIKSKGLSLEKAFHIINPYNACGEIIRHIMLEAFLELGEDVNLLFKYCGELLSNEPLEDLLVKGYFLRVSLLDSINYSTPLMLTNPQLWEFLTNQSNNADEEGVLDSDVISWEVFRQIISPRIDPLNGERVDLILKLLEERQEQIESLRLKCFSLAEKIKQYSTLPQLTNQVKKLVRIEVEKEVSELLMLDKRAIEEFFKSVFSDEKTWFSTLSFIAGIVSGTVPISTGAAIATISSIGAKAVQALVKKRENLRQSDYALVYTIVKRT